MSNIKSDIFNKTILIWKKTWKRLGKIIEKCKSFVKNYSFRSLHLMTAINSSHLDSKKKIREMKTLKTIKTLKFKKIVKCPILLLVQNFGHGKSFWTFKWPKFCLVRNGNSIFNFLKSKNFEINSELHKIHETKSG